MVVLAFSLQDQVEKYGAYVGLAAFLGLAVLTLLYFAQARELKRLRDWAGRAPERAQELEARVVAQAEEARRVPEPAAERSGAVGPAQPVTAGNGRPAEAPVAVPMGPRPAVAMARAAATVAAAAEVAEEQVAAPVPDGAGPPPTDGEGPGEDTAEHAAVAATNGDEPAEPQADAPEPEAAEPEAEPEPEPAKDTDDAPALPGNGVPAPVTIPRATPRPQPRPAAPLRATPSRSATLPPRRPGPPPRRPAKEPSRAGRWTLFTLLAIGVAVAAVAVPVFLLGGDEPAPAPNTTAESTPDAATGGGGGGGTEAVAARPETVVTVLNGTPTEGLASQTRDKLIADGYSDEQGMIRTGNNTDQQRQDSVIFFADGERQQARDVGSILGIRALEAIDPETQALADATDATNSGQPSKVVVLLGSDQSP